MIHLLSIFTKAIFLLQIVLEQAQSKGKWNRKGFNSKIWVRKWNRAMFPL